MSASASASEIVVNLPCVFTSHVSIPPSSRIRIVDVFFCLFNGQGIFGKGLVGGVEEGGVGGGGEFRIDWVLF